MVQNKKQSTENNIIWVFIYQLQELFLCEIMCRNNG